MIASGNHTIDYATWQSPRIRIIDTSALFGLFLVCSDFPGGEYLIAGRTVERCLDKLDISGHVGICGRKIIVLCFLGAGIDDL